MSHTPTPTPSPLLPFSARLPATKQKYIQILYSLSPTYEPPFKCVEVDLIYCGILKLINKKTVNTISILISTAVAFFEVHLGKGWVGSFLET